MEKNTSMKNLILALILTFVSSAALVFAQAPNANSDPNQGPDPSQGISIIPQPLSIEKGEGEFKITAETKIIVTPGNAGLKLLAGMLADRLKQLSGLEIPVSEHEIVIDKINGTGIDWAKNAFVLIVLPKEDSLGREGYSLAVEPGLALLTANDGHGIFYGLQTIYQLLPPDPHAAEGALSIPAVKITDKPRYAWRGMMLDVGRYFYPVSFIKKFLDYLAMHKMNTFHWHLTEDHGWRIEIKKYPLLTEKSAWRDGTQMNPGGQIDPNLHGGYYTQDEVREIVAYAQERYITVVPEIEMPGHSLSALIAYPELSCSGGPFEMPVKWGIQKDIYCAGNEKTFKFLEDVLSEVADLFPGPIIHIGGDEAPKDRWEACSKCQARIKAEGLKDEHELQSYFITRIEKFLETKNKRIIGWDEILEGGLAPNAAVMSWRGIEGGIAAAKQHHNVVMTPTSHLYFDYYQGDPTLEPFAIGGLTTLQEVYAYEPTPEELTAEEAKYILGVQGNIWSEYIHSPEKVEYMGFPRAAALAEIAWTQPGLKDWENFKRKMESQYERYAGAGINYSSSAYNVRQVTVIDSVAQKATVSFSTDSFDPQIYYTLDGSEPTPGDLKYEQPIEVDKPLIIKAANFRDGKRVSAISKQYFNEERLHQN